MSEIEKLLPVGSDAFVLPLPGFTPDPSVVSNARLIAAAPAMFEALRKIAANPGWMDDEVGFMSGHIAKAALREASGQNV